MAELVVAPLLEPFEDRMEAVLGVRLEMAEDRDIAGIADLFRQVGGVVDELGPEIGVFLLLGQKPEIDRNTCFTKGIIDEARVPRFIARHQLEQLRDVRIGPAPLHFLVEHTAREFGGAAGDQEVDEFLLQLGLHIVPVDVIPVFVLLEMTLVGVAFHLIDQVIPVLAHRADVDCVELVEIGGVEARGEQGVLHGHIGGGLAVELGLLFLNGETFLDGGGVGGVLGLHVHSITSSEKENSHSSITSKSPVSRVQSCSSLEARKMIASRSSETISPNGAMISGPWTLTSSPG